MSREIPSSSREIQIKLQNLCDRLRNTNGNPVEEFINFIKSLKTYSQDKGCNFRTLWHPKIRSNLEETLLELVENLLRGHKVFRDGKIRLLSIGKNGTTSLTKHHAFIIVLNGFFCTFPSNHHYANIPSMNFFSLFNLGFENGGSSIKVEKLSCILHYFKRMMRAPETFECALTFVRRCMSRSESPQWSSSEKRLCKIEIRTNGKIEDCKTLLQVDFANKYIGGGVLGRGCVMEEILFVTHPEMIAARAFTECLSDPEVLIFLGPEQYSQTKGYSDTFAFDGDFKDPTPTDSYGRKLTEILAIDAINFSKKPADQQFEKEFINRELLKCFCGFQLKDGQNKGIAAGKWGCGAFKGDPQLKFLIQWLAASEAQRPLLVMYTNGDQTFSKDLERLNSIMLQRNPKVGSIYSAIISYQESIRRHQWPKDTGIFTYLINCPQAIELIEGKPSQMQNVQRIQNFGQRQNEQKGESPELRNVFLFLESMGRLWWLENPEKVTLIKLYAKNHGHLQNLQININEIQGFEVSTGIFTRVANFFVGPGINNKMLWIDANMSNLRILTEQIPLGKGEKLIFFDRLAPLIDMKKRTSQVVLLCEVSLGVTHQSYNGTPGSYQYFDTIKMMGNAYPNGKETQRFGNTKRIPCGRTKFENINHPSYNKYLVGDVNRVKISYIIKFCI